MGKEHKKKLLGGIKLKRRKRTRKLEIDKKWTHINLVGPTSSFFSNMDKGVLCIVPTNLHFPRFSPTLPLHLSVFPLLKLYSYVTLITVESRFKVAFRKNMHKGMS